MSNLGNFVWSIADQLRGVYKPHQYGDVILPFTILRRLDCILEPTGTRCGRWPRSTTARTRSRSRSSARPGSAFYNTSSYDFANLLADPDGLAANLIDYIDRFSAEHRRLRAVQVRERDRHPGREEPALPAWSSKFAEVDLHPDDGAQRRDGRRVRGADPQVRRGLERGRRRALHPARRDPADGRPAVRRGRRRADSSPASSARIYDPTAGTGGMLRSPRSTCSQQQPRRPAAPVRPGDQRPVLRDLQVRHARQGPGRHQHPPRQHARRRRVHGPHVRLLHVQPALRRGLEAVARGRQGGARRKPARTAASAPGSRRSSDGQMLFLLHLAHKMRPAQEGGGRVGIVLNGSPLFNGAAESGPSKIRQWLLENDLVEAIVALPTNMFYNTGIATYIWILDNTKHPERKGKVQLIDGTVVLDQDAQEPRRQGPRDQRRRPRQDRRRCTPPSTTPTPSYSKVFATTTSATGRSPSNARCSTRTASRSPTARATPSPTRRSATPRTCRSPTAATTDGAAGQAETIKAYFDAEVLPARPRRLDRLRRRPRSATRSRSPATSTSTSRPGRSPRSTPTWRSRSPRSSTCCGRSSGEPARPRKSPTVANGSASSHWLDGLQPLWSMFVRIKDIDHPEEQMLSVFRDHGVVAKTPAKTSTKRLKTAASTSSSILAGWSRTG